MNISLIHQALRTYKHEKQAYLLPIDRVKPSQLENAKKHICKDGIVGSPVALMDTTLFGSGKEGVLVTEHNLYIRMGGRDKISINDLRLVELSPTKKTDIMVNYWGRPAKRLYASIYAQDLEDFLSRLAAYNNRERQEKMQAEAQKTEEATPAAATTESAEALYERGFAYFDSNDWENAMPLIIKAANMDYAPAQNHLGVDYKRGEGVAKDMEKAFFWLEKAAAQGNVKAMRNLALTYRNGTDCPRNDREAAEWYTRAAELGDSRSQNSLAIMYEEGEGVPQSWSAAIKWYEKAAAQDNINALYNLGRSYFNGLGVEKDLTKARSYWQRAADLGDEDAQKRLPEVNKLLNELKKPAKAKAPAPAPKPAAPAPKPAAPAPKPAAPAPKPAAPAPKPVAPAPKPVAPAPKPAAAPTPKSTTVAGASGTLQNARVGDRISFGRYPSKADGTVAPIEWVVLDKQADRILVLSTHVLDAQPFFKKEPACIKTPNWEESYARRWLNYHFLNDAFTPGEAGAILSSRLSTPVNPDHDSFLKANPRSRQPRCPMSSPDTEDQIFLLSWEEVCKYLCGGEQPKLRYSEDENGKPLDDQLQWYDFSGEKAAAPVTGYSDSKLQEESPWGSWLLRSSHSAEEILLVTSGNDIQFDGVLELSLMLNDLDIQSDRPAPGSILLRSATEAYGIRPAMWLKLDAPESKPAPSAAASCNAAQMSADACEKLALDFEYKWEAEQEKYRGRLIPEAAIMEISDHLNRAIYWAKTGRNKGSAKCGELLSRLLAYRASDWRFRTKGSTVYFGRYPTSKDGKEAPIPWTVLAKDGDRKLFVVSKHVLDRRVFADTDATCWADSSIRSWLNGEFLEKAFREYGTENILETAVHTSVNPDYDCILKTDPHPDIPRYTAPSPDTTDRVFLLSWEEVCKYLCGDTPEVQSSGFVDGKRTFRQQLRWYQFQHYKASAVPTDYVRAIAPQYYEDVSSAPIWMLRNPCSASRLLVVDDGYYLLDAERKGIYRHRSNAAYRAPATGSICVRELTEPYGVRPAMWLELDDPE